MSPVTPSTFSNAYIALDDHAPLAAVYPAHGAQHFAAVDAEYRRFQLAVTGGVIQGLALIDVSEGHIRPGKNQAHHQVRHHGSLGCRLFQEFQSDRRVEKQIAHHKGCAFRAGSFLNGKHLSALVACLQAADVAAGAGSAGNPADRRDGGQCLAPEAQGGYGLQILRAGNLAGGMALEGHADIAGGNAAAVIRHAEIADSPIADFHRHSAGARVKAVFHQLLDGRGRAFNHLARGNFADNLVIQQLNLGHELPPFLTACVPFRAKGTAC